MNIYDARPGDLLRSPRRHDDGAIGLVVGLDRLLGVRVLWLFAADSWIGKSRWYVRASLHGWHVER